MRIERSGTFSNYGPTNQALEQAFIQMLFGSTGHCVTMCNATIGLILSIRHVIDARSRRNKTWRKARKYALMPAFTFAAAAHAALWNGLVPLFCDIAPDTWLPSAASERELLERFKDEVAVIVPHAAFGNNLDLAAYTALSEQYGVPIVVDAAASLGALDCNGRQFGAGFPYPLVYSMHVTKTFSTGEAGLVYCNDSEAISSLRSMANFGFGQPRAATMLGLNGKLTEVGALLCHEKLKDLEAIVQHRSRLADIYRRELPEFTFQKMNGARHAYQFVPVLVPDNQPLTVDNIIAELANLGVMARSYFTPHLAEQPFFEENSVCLGIPTTQSIAQRMISLPMYDDMTSHDVETICQRLRSVMANRPPRNA